jgi:hypothetical protein
MNRAQRYVVAAEPKAQAKVPSLRLRFRLRAYDANHFAEKP